jgi:DNA-binding response OmpR family regulator
MISELILMNDHGRSPRPVVPDGAPDQQILRILVVDDDPDTAVSLATLLQLSGHEAFIAHDGATALEVAEHQRPGVVLLDVGLPGISGYEVCRRLRAYAWATPTVIVALTARVEPGYAAQACEAGFDAHVVKPLDYTSLVNLVDALVQDRS